MLMRRAALLLGLLLVALTIVFAIPGNGVFETSGHRVPGTVLSHFAMLMALWGAAPALRGALAGLDGVALVRLRAALAVAIVAPPLALSLLRLVAPSATHQLITREWGVVEPLQVALYACALWLCLAVRRALPRDDRARTIYGAGAIVTGVMILEEIDYLDIVNLLVRVVWSPHGRMGRKHIGGFHDMVDAWSHHAGLLVVVLSALGALIVLWAILGRYHATVRHELTRESAIPLGVFVLALLTAQLVDIDDQFVPSGWRLGLLEEPLELLAGLALNAALILRLLGARRR
jgi:hypothetical protein